MRLHLFTSPNYFEGVNENGEKEFSVNRTYLILCAKLISFHGWRFKRWHHDGLPRYNIRLGWFEIRTGLDHEWVPSNAYSTEP